MIVGYWESSRLVVIFLLEKFSFFVVDIFVVILIFGRYFFFLNDKNVLFVGWYFGVVYYCRKKYFCSVGMELVKLEIMRV